MISMAIQISCFPMTIETQFVSETMLFSALPLFVSTILPMTCGEILTRLTQQHIHSYWFHLQKPRRVLIPFGMQPSLVSFMLTFSILVRTLEISDTIEWNFSGYGGSVWFLDMHLARSVRDSQKLASFRIQMNSPLGFWTRRMSFEDVTSFRLSWMVKLKTFFQRTGTV